MNTSLSQTLENDCTPWHNDRPRRNLLLMSNNSNIHIPIHQNYQPTSKPPNSRHNTVKPPLNQNLPEPLSPQFLTSHMCISSATHTNPAILNLQRSKQVG